MLRAIAPRSRGSEAMEDMDLRAALLAIHRALSEREIDHALIGGLALSVHGAARATVDLDWIADGRRDSDVDVVMRAHGYEPIYRTSNVGNYLSEDPAKGRVDFLFVRRERGLAILHRAASHGVLGERVRVVDASDLIGLKVQAYANNPNRKNRDLADIERLLTFGEVDMERVRMYFRLFEFEGDLDQLLARLGRT
jgi:hypothetical protein